jgi:hypothetical protein
LGFLQQLGVMVAPHLIVVTNTTERQVI